MSRILARLCRRFHSALVLIGKRGSGSSVALPPSLPHTVNIPDMGRRSRLDRIDEYEDEYAEQWRAVRPHLVVVSDKSIG